MFNYIIANLSTEIRDLILRPPDENPYDKVKEQLIKRTAASEQRRLQQLFSTEELGDHKLRQLAGDTLGLPDGTFLRELFLQRLPANVRMVLASTRDGSSQTKLLKLPFRLPYPMCRHRYKHPKYNNCEQKLPALLRLRKHRRSQSNSFSRRRSLSPAGQPRPPSENSDLCWYHYKFGDFALKCKPPCSKSRNDQASH